MKERKGFLYYFVRNRNGMSRTGLGCSHLAVRFRYGYAHCRRDRHTGGPAVRL